MNLKETDKPKKFLWICSIVGSGVGISLQPPMRHKGKKRKIKLQKLPAW